MNIELNIDAIKLNGFKTNDHEAIRQALTTELTRLFAERGVPVSFQIGGTIPNIRQADFKAAPESAPESIGTQLAQSIYGGF